MKILYHNSEIERRELVISAADPLHFDRFITRFIKSASMCSLVYHAGIL